jgi:hypothetical protein
MESHLLTGLRSTIGGGLSIRKDNDGGPTRALEEHRSRFIQDFVQFGALVEKLNSSRSIGHLHAVEEAEWDDLSVLSTEYDLTRVVIAVGRTANEGLNESPFFLEGLRPRNRSRCVYDDQQIVNDDLFIRPRDHRGRSKRLYFLTR